MNCFINSASTEALQRFHSMEWSARFTQQAFSSCCGPRLHANCGHSTTGNRTLNVRHVEGNCGGGRGVERVDGAAEREPSERRATASHGAAEPFVLAADGEHE